MKKNVFVVVLVRCLMVTLKICSVVDFVLVDFAPVASVNAAIFVWIFFFVVLVVMLLARRSVVDAR